MMPLRKEWCLGLTLSLSWTKKDINRPSAVNCGEGATYRTWSAVTFTVFVDSVSSTIWKWWIVNLHLAHWKLIDCIYWKVGGCQDHGNGCAKWKILLQQPLNHTGGWLKGNRNHVHFLFFAQIRSLSYNNSLKMKRNLLIALEWKATTRDQVLQKNVNTALFNPVIF